MSIVKDVLIEEINERIQLSNQYALTIKNAKTKLKQNRYKHKLKKNNEIVADLLISLDKIIKNTKNEEPDV